MWAQLQPPVVIISLRDTALTETAEVASQPCHTCAKSIDIHPKDYNTPFIQHHADWIVIALDGYNP